MSFHEVRFPTDISYGSKGGPGYNTSIIVTDGGNEERVARWQSAKRTFDVHYGIKSREQMQAVVQFYLLRQGATFGFRYKDWLDFNSSVYGHNVPPDAATNTTATDQVIGTGDGSVTTFQLIKTYSDTVSSKVRTITKPVDATVLIAVAGTPTVSGWTVDSTTGVVTFGSPPSPGDQITAGFEFDVPVRFAKSNDTVLMAAIDDYGYGSLDPIELAELSDGLFVAEENNCGGSVVVCMSSDYQLAAGYARTYIFEPQGSGLSVILPDPSNLPPGGPFFWLVNYSLIDTITVKDNGGSTLITLTGRQMIMVAIIVDGSGTHSWVAL